MRTLAQPFKRFLASEDGPTTVEYALMLAVIVAVCLGAIVGLGTSSRDTFNTVSSSMGGSPAGS